MSENKIGDATVPVAVSKAAQQAFKDCVRLRELAGRQTLTVGDNRELDAIADRLHALAVSRIDTGYDESEELARQRDDLRARLHRIHAAAASDLDLAGLAVRDFLVREAEVAALPDVMVGLVPGSESGG